MKAIRILIIASLIAVLFNSDFTFAAESVQLSVTVVSTSTPPSSNDGGVTFTPSLSQVIFYGYAYPSSKVVLLRDGNVVAETQATSTSGFEIRLSELSGGAYTFSLLAEDPSGVRSPLKTFTQWISPGATTIISNIVFAPTISSDKVQTQKGTPITMSGYTMPSTSIELLFTSTSTDIVKTTTSTFTGAWKYSFDTDSLPFSTYNVSARSKIQGYYTDYSQLIPFTIGTTNIFTSGSPCQLRGDFNNDCKVNLIDFSILLYWFDRSNPPQALDLNKDGRVGIADFSIMAFHWTG